MKKTKILVLICMIILLTGCSDSTGNNESAHQTQIELPSIDDLDNELPYDRVQEVWKWSKNFIENNYDNDGYNELFDDSINFIKENYNTFWEDPNKINDALVYGSFLSNTFYYKLDNDLFTDIKDNADYQKAITRQGHNLYKLAGMIYSNDIEDKEKLKKYYDLMVESKDYYQENYN